MPSIQDSGLPLVFEVVDDPFLVSSTSDSVITAVRSLEGMQKEALVSTGTVSSGGAWRIVSDEGPYLDGTDLAPFPLAFFTAGLQFSLVSQLVQCARARDLSFESLEVVLDNRYTMNGSFLRGDAAGGAQPAEVDIDMRASGSSDRVADLVRLAEASSPAHALMREPMTNTFDVHLNGRWLSDPNGAVPPDETVVDPRPHFDGLRVDRNALPPPEFIVKTAAAEHVSGVEGGAGSSLNPEQKRTLHIRGRATLMKGLRMAAEIELLRPIGSTFRLLCDEAIELGGESAAPSPLAYLSAATGFCFMTQLGRYAHIIKRDLTSYAILQRGGFSWRGSAADGTLRATAHPVHTHVFVEGNQSDDEARQLARMSEQTCFLHAAMRGSHPSVIRARLNGEELEV